MKHTIKDKKNLGNNNWLIAIELNPDNDFEKGAIQKAENADATEAEREMLDNYLLFCLGDTLSLISLEQQKQNLFIVKAFQN